MSIETLLREQLTPHQIGVCAKMWRSGYDTSHMADRCNVHQAVICRYWHTIRVLANAMTPTRVRRRA